MFSGCMEDPTCKTEGACCLSNCFIIGDGKGLKKLNLTRQTLFLTTGILCFWRLDLNKLAIILFGIFAVKQTIR